LCDDADGVVQEVVSGFANVAVDHALLDDNAEWIEAYADKIPVIHIDGDEVAYWRISHDTLNTELESRGGISLTTDAKE
jgi:hypothetical protein